jgi:hypothetical protein
MTTIEPPIATSRKPAAIVHRRSKPVKGSDVAFFAAVVDVGSVAFSGVVVFSGVLLSFDGDVPVVGVGEVGGDDVGVVPGVVVDVVFGVVL